MYICVYVYRCTYVCMCIDVHMYTGMYVSVDVHMHMRACTYIMGFYTRDVWYREFSLTTIYKYIMI